MRPNNCKNNDHNNQDNHNDRDNHNEEKETHLCAPAELAYLSIERLNINSVNRFKKLFERKTEKRFGSIHGNSVNASGPEFESLFPLSFMIEKSFGSRFREQFVIRLY